MAKDGFNSRSLSDETIERLNKVAADILQPELSDTKVIDFLLSYYEKHGMNKSVTTTKGASNETSRDT